MKTMTCNQLAGACDMPFHGDSFEEIAEMSKQHAMKMAENGDQAHIAKMEEMTEFMKNPEEMQEWMEKKRMEYDALPEDKS